MYILDIRKSSKSSKSNPYNIGYSFQYRICRCARYRLISPFHVPSVNPNVSMQCCHLGPPLSFRLRYCNSFCRLCTSNLRFRLLALSFLPLVCKNSASVLIFAVRIAICTSLEPVSGPPRFIAAGLLVGAGSAPGVSFADGFGGRIGSVL